MPTKDRPRIIFKVMYIITLAIYIATVLVYIYHFFDYLENFEIMGQMETAVQFHSDQYAYPEDMRSNLDSFKTNVINFHRFSLIAGALLLLPVLSMIFLVFLKGEKIDHADRIAILILYWCAIASFFVLRYYLIL